MIDGIIGEVRVAVLTRFWVDSVRRFWTRVWTQNRETAEIAEPPLEADLRSVSGSNSGLPLDAEFLAIIKKAIP